MFSLRKVILTCVLLLGAVSSFAEGGTLSRFTSVATSSSNQFTAGTVILGSSPSTALISFSTMTPGDSVTTPLTVSNTGTLSLLYAVATTITNADSKGLGAQLTLSVKSGVTTCTNADFGGSGTTVYSTAALGNIGSSRNIIGDPTAHPNGGRTLAASGSEVLCFQVSLPSSIASAYQGATTTATFTFTAEQN